MYIHTYMCLVEAGGLGWVKERPLAGPFHGVLSFVPSTPYDVQDRQTGIVHQVSWGVAINTGTRSGGMYCFRDFCQRYIK